LYAANEPIDKILALLKEQGVSKIDRIRDLRTSLGFGLSDAKDVVHRSRVWEDRRDSEDAFHDRVIAIIEAEEKKYAEKVAS
jgi:ribosomal protein L7/L12